MKKIRLLLIVSLMLNFTTCNDREDYFASSNKNVNISLESPLTACTSSYPGFINLDYAFNFTLSPEYPNANPFPLVAKYTCENAGSFELSMGNKRYSPNDTIMFNALSKKMMLNVSKPGTYRFLIQFYKEKKQNEILGTYEFNFVIGMPDLNMVILKDGIQVENLNETVNFQETSGEITIRISSEKEKLNNGKLSLKVNFAGSAINVLNWDDNDVKVSRESDDKATVEYKVLYKNASVGTARFTFKAYTEISQVSREMDMTVMDIPAGGLNLAAEIMTDFKGQMFYSREKIWVGQTDSIEYIITPDKNDPIKKFNIKFEMTDPQKINIFSTGNTLYQNQYTRYDVNTYYDFTNRLKGKLYFVFTSLATYTDTVTLSLKNASGAEKKYRLYIGCKQTEDFNFSVAFKHELDDEGYDVIKYSEIEDILLKNSVKLNVTDENPYSKYDYKFSYIGTNSRQNQLAHAIQKNNIDFIFPLVDTWLGNEYGYIQNNTGTFNIRCLETPKSNDYVGNFNWEYTVKRISDNKTKTVIRKIKIIDDRLQFGFELSPLNTDKKESAYINEPLTMYRIVYKEPSINSSEYSVKITSTNIEIADIYLIQPNTSYQKIAYDNEVNAPASHNTQGTELGNASGSIQIKGKASGSATLTFVVKHKLTNTGATFTKNIQVINDPVSFLISPINPKDSQGKTTTANFGGELHTYKTAGFKIRINNSSKFSGNSSGKVKIGFNLSSSNVHTLYLNNTYKNGDVVELNYNQEYEYIFSDRTYGGWSESGVNALIKCNLDIISATNQEVQITTKVNDIISYRIVRYVCPIIIADYSYIIAGYSERLDENWGITIKDNHQAVYRKGFSNNAFRYIQYFTGSNVTFSLSGETTESYVPQKYYELSPAKPPESSSKRGHVVEIFDNWGYLVEKWQIDL